MTGWELILAGALFGSLALWRWPGPPPVSFSPKTDIIVVAALGFFSWLYVRYWHEAMNPAWVPNGHDNHDYFKCMVALKFGEPELWNPFRYPLYPALSVALSWITGQPLYRAGMEMSLISSALVPVGVYVLGRAIASGPVALAGALFALRFEIDPMILGTPTAYPLAVATYAAALGAVLFAVRDGGRVRHLLGGLALAAYVATTAKALPLLLASIATILAVSCLRGRRDAIAVGLFIAPLVACWGAFSALDLPLHPLEGLVHDVQVQGQMIDPAVPFPDVGWGPEMELSMRGYWVIGEMQSLIHMPDVMRYLLSPPIRTLPAADALDAMVEGIGVALHLQNRAWLVVAGIFGALGVWAGGPAALPRIAALVLACAMCAVHLWGLANMPFVPFWALPVTYTTPVLILAAASLPGRLVRATTLRQWVLGVPLLAAFLWSYFGTRESWGAKDLADFSVIRRETTAYRIAVIHDVLPLVRAGDDVLDATETQLARALFDNTGVRFTKTRFEMYNGQFGLEAEGSGAPQRWILLEGMTSENHQPNHPYAEAYAWFTSQPERFQRFDECLYLDREPSLPINTQPYRPPPELPPAEGPPPVDKIGLPETPTPPDPAAAQPADGQVPVPP